MRGGTRNNTIQAWQLLAIYTTSIHAGTSVAPPRILRLAGATEESGAARERHLARRRGQTRRPSPCPLPRVRFDCAHRRRGRGLFVPALAAVTRPVAELLFDPQQLVVLRYSVAPRRRASLDLPAVSRDGDIRNGRIFRLAAAVT